MQDETTKGCIFNFFNSKPVERLVVNVYFWFSRHAFRTAYGRWPTREERLGFRRLVMSLCVRSVLINF